LVTNFEFSFYRKNYNNEFDSGSDWTLLKYIWYANLTFLK